MSDKEQIKIHGVDVLKCKYYQYQSLKDCEGHLSIAGHCQIGKILYDFSDDLEDCLNIERFCIDNPNCLFKQLARKTQECDTLKSQLDFELQQKEGFEQECEQLEYDYQKQLENTKKWIAECESLDKRVASLEEIADDLQQRNHHLTQECEELKEYIRMLEFKNTISQNCSQQLDNSMTKVNLYRKALEEIEEIANVLITETNEYSKCCHKDVCGESDVSKHKKIEKIEKIVPCPYGNVAYCQYEAVDNILTIIKELKGE